MKIVVLVKQVPIVTAMRFDPETRRLNREGVPSEVSAFDVRALVRAVELRDEHGGEVVVATMGPVDARNALVHCLALGADRGLHLLDPAFAGSDTLATARVLAAALRHEGFDLVLCGRNSVDAETGQVGPEVAEILGIAQVTAAHRVTLMGTLLRAERETDDGYETVEAELPVLVTVAEDVASERFPNKAAREVANGKPIHELGAKDLSLSPDLVGASGSPTKVEGLEVVESNREARLIEADSPALAMEALAAEIAARGMLDKDGASRGSDPAAPAPDRISAVEGPAYWVVVEILGDRVRPVTFELLGKANELARRRQGHVAAVLLGGPGVAEHVDVLVAHGADAAYVADDAWLDPYTTDAHASVLAGAIQARNPATVLMASTAIGRDLAPRVAARLNLGLTGDCIDLGLKDDGRLIQYKPAFGGNVTAPILSSTKPEMATVRPGMLAALTPSFGRRTQWERLAVDSVKGMRVRVVDRSEGTAAEAQALDTAAVVIGVGKGIGGPENLGILQELADTLKGTFCATREVTDLGWLPRQTQVGLTGRAIAPALYIAVAVRGSPEHTVGIRRAGFVVAINKNAKAPIFKDADRGFVGDYGEAVPALIAALKRRIA